MLGWPAWVWVGLCASEMSFPLLFFMTRVFLFLAWAAAVGAGDRPLVIAHRGASGYLPEHSAAAKAYAYAQGADYLEQDLVLTKDGVPVVLHDIYVDTVTDVAEKFPGRARGDGRYYVLDFTVGEIKQLQVRERFQVGSGEAVYPGRFPSRGFPGAFQVATLEEELQLIQGLNRSTGRDVGIYPEIKQPKWHREQGVDLSAAVLPILARYGYQGKGDRCFLQCFELAEVRRLRRELGWKGRMILLMGGAGKEVDGTDWEELCTLEGLRGLADVVEGIGPPLERVVQWPVEGGGAQLTGLAARAHQVGLAVHPWSVRVDALPKHCPSVEALHAALLGEAGVEGVFTDFTDVTRQWLERAAAVRR